VVLTNTLNLDLPDYHVGPDVEVVIYPVNNAVASAAQLTCLQLPTPDALTRFGDYGGHIQRDISRILRARAYLDLLALCRPSPPDYMMVISRTGRGALGSSVVLMQLWVFSSWFDCFFASHDSIFKVPSDCYTTAAHTVR
jgi:hypothetical protein